MIAKAALNSILSFLLSFAVVFSPFPLKAGKAVRVQDQGKYPFKVYESELQKGSALYHQRSYSYEDGEVLMLRADVSKNEKDGGVQDNPAVISFYELEVPAGAEAVIYTDAEPLEIVLEEGVVPCTAAVINAGNSYVFIDMPSCFEDLGSSVVRQVKDYQSCLLVKKSGGKLKISAICACCGDVCDCTVLTLRGSKKQDCFEAAGLWTSYLEDGEAKWLCDGYYRTVPAAYVPTCEKDGYYRCAASFIINVLAEKMTENRACSLLALACWDSVMQNQNEEGFWPTGPESVWLSGDYGIGAGFYDTRFNTDLMLTGCLICEGAGALPQPDRVKKYAAFYLDHLAEYSRASENGGLLAADYSGPGQSTAVHTSLNHQTAETLAAFKLAKLLKNESLADAAEKLLLGIESGTESWIKPDGDLWYSVSADGVYSGKDYVSLTYDDLLTLQRYLVSSGRSESPVITRLLESKKNWMDSNNIGDYLK